jgi:peptidoglycan/LPS O-acetylase OafA/YrhL
VGVAAAVVLWSALAPRESAAQFAEPCSTACALTLGATGVVAATGAVVAFGRLEGGMSTTSRAAWTGAVGFAFVVGSGMALSGNGGRQERAVYGAAIGSATGALLGLAFGSMGGSGDGSPRLAGTLVGAAAGVIIGGVYGALSHGEGGYGAAAPGLAITVSF